MTTTAALSAWDVEDVELAAGGGFGGEFLGGVVAHVVAVDDVVVPVARAELEGVRALEAEGAFPGARLGVTVVQHGERELVLVVVP